MTADCQPDEPVSDGSGTVGTFWLDIPVRPPVPAMRRHPDAQIFRSDTVGEFQFIELVYKLINTVKLLHRAPPRPVCCSS